MHNSYCIMQQFHIPKKMCMIHTKLPGKVRYKLHILETAISIFANSLNNLVNRYM